MNLHVFVSLCLCVCVRESEHVCISVTLRVCVIQLITVPPFPPSSSSRPLLSVGSTKVCHCHKNRVTRTVSSCHAQRVGGRACVTV